MRLTASGRPFFANRHTRQTTWADPRATAPLPAGWQQGIDRDEHVYYIDTVHRRTQRARPTEGCVVEMGAARPASRTSLGSWESLSSLLSSVSARSVEAVQGRWCAVASLVRPVRQPLIAA